MNSIDRHTLSRRQLLAASASSGIRLSWPRLASGDGTGETYRHSAAKSVIPSCFSTAVPASSKRSTRSRMPRGKSGRVRIDRYGFGRSGHAGQRVSAAGWPGWRTDTRSCGRCRTTIWYHGSATYLTMTGRYHHARKSSNPSPTPEDIPTFGAAIKR